MLKIFISCLIPVGRCKPTTGIKPAPIQMVIWIEPVPDTAVTS